MTLEQRRTPQTSGSAVTRVVVDSVQRTTRIVLPEDQPATAEHLLQEAVRRALRKPAGRLALVLHLSALTPPAPFPHHRRIARSVLEDAAQLHGGEVHSLGNGDVVLLCHLPARGDPAQFRAALQHLFQIDAEQPQALISTWLLDRERPALLAYVAERMRQATGQPNPAPLGLMAPPPPEPPESQSQSIGPIAGLMRRQTAIRLEPQVSGGAPRGRMRPLFREVSVSMAALDRRVTAVRQARTDPFLLRTLATELDELVLEEMLGELPEAAGLRPAGGIADAVKLHLNLSVAGILSETFTRFAQSGSAVAIEVQMIEVCADPAAFAAARARIADAGFALVLDGISHLALGLVSPAALHPDMVKLEWSPRLAQAPSQESGRIGEALAALHPDRVILDRADSEQALRWGLARGLRNFQGAYPDVLQATQRLGSCAAGRHCTLWQCESRAAAVDRPTRAECGNHLMLDQGHDSGGHDEMAPRAPIVR